VETRIKTENGHGRRRTPTSNQRTRLYCKGGNVATLNDLPELSQKVFLALDAQKAKSVFALVDELGMNQTTLQEQLTALHKSGWLDMHVLHDGSPAGGPCNGYTQKRPS
jgi:predicted Rossmann fold nucleotide-binding protein DprA/Smf involved in DNA uptake